MKIIIIIPFSKFFQNIHQNASNVTCLKSFTMSSPNSKRVFKLFIFYIENDIFRKNLKTKSGQNTHQNACRFATCKIPNLKTEYSWPLPPKSWLRLCIIVAHRWVAKVC